MLTPPPGRAPGRIYVIDVLRGVAILGVVVSHSFPHEPCYDYLRHSHPYFTLIGRIIATGVLGLPLFFVISGFCIHLPHARRLAERADESIDVGVFWIRRIKRLYPPYLLVLLASMTMVLVSWMLGRAHYYPEPQLNWIALDFLAHIPMLHGFHPLFDYGGGNPPMWSLAREEYFYVLYFLLMPLRNRAGLPAVTLLVIGIGILFPYFVTAHITNGVYRAELLRSSTFVLWSQWVLGALAAEAYVGLVELPAWASKWWLVPVWLLAAKFNIGIAKGHSALLNGMAFFTLLNWAVRENRVGLLSPGRFMNLVADLGLISYSLYLLHYPSFMGLREVFPFIRDPSGIGVALIGMLVKCAVALAGSVFFFRFFESRFLNTPVRFYQQVHATFKSPPCL